MRTVFFQIFQMMSMTALVCLPQAQACMTVPDKIFVSGSSFQNTNLTALNQHGQVTLVFDDSPVSFDEKLKCWKLAKAQECLEVGFKTELFDSTNTKKEGVLRLTKPGELKLYSVRPDGNIDMSKPALVFSAKSESVICGAGCDATETDLEIVAEQNGSSIGSYQVHSSSKDPRFRSLGFGANFDLKGHEVIGTKDCASKPQVRPYGSSGGSPAGSQTSSGGGAI